VTTVTSRGPQGAAATRNSAGDEAASSARALNLGRGHANHVHIPGWLFLVVVLLAIVPWMWIALGKGTRDHALTARSSPPAVNAPAPTAEGRIGPWGEIESVEVVLLPSEELIPGGWADPKPVEWFFPGYTVEKLAEWLRSLPLTPACLRALSDVRRWQAEPAGVVVQVPDELVLDLDPKSRAAIYRVLIRSERNPHHSPWSLPTNLWLSACRTAGVSDATRQALERAAHREGGRIYIADVAAVLNQTTSPEEKNRIVRLTSSATAQFLYLRIRPDTDVADLVLYWAGRGRRKDLRPIFEALKALPGGGTLDISHLLPAFARQRIFTYPHPAQASDGVRRDCHWTSLNFFSIVPDDRFGDSSYAQQYILQHYYQIGDVPAFGDLVFFVRPDGSVIHSAVYLAADYVFTKNGDTARQPWTIMDLKDLRELYSVLSPEGLNVQYWRNRDQEN